MCDLSIVIPLYNEEESLNELTTWIKKTLDSQGYNFEIIFIDDGSTDKSWDIIEDLQSKYGTIIRALKFRRNYGKSAALNVGFDLANGRYVVTMDADLQDSPEEIHPMILQLNAEKLDLVSGWKKKRFDPPSKTIPTKLYNAVTSYMSGIKLHDMNCGLKVYTADVVKNIEVYGEMHRYIPVIAKWAGFNKIGEKIVTHQARKYGNSKFGLSRFIYGPLDLASIMFVGKFGKRPMHFFGVIGSAIIAIGILILSYLSLEKVIWNTIGIATRPAFYLGILSVIVGVQLFIAGFIGELISRNSTVRNEYKIAKRI